MAKPKLALIPASQGTKLYSVLPADGVGDFTFSRNSAATRINKDGLIETVASGVSRLNYPLIDGVVNGCPSHLLEPSRLQLIQYSEEFDNSYWSSARIETPYIADTISPDGTLNAYTLEISSGETGGGGVYKSLSVVGDNSISVFAKKSTVDYLVLADTGLDSSRNAVYFNLENGTVATEYNAVGKMQDFGNGWYRCTMKYTLTSSGNKFIYMTNIDGSTSNAVQGGDSIYIYGSQLEQGSYSTSYIPNYGTAAGITRSAETANGAGDASTFNDSEGVLMVEISGFNETVYANNWISLTDGTTNQNNYVSIQQDTTGNIISRVRVNGVNSAVLYSTIIDQSLSSKIAIKYKLNDFSLYVNGFEYDSNNVGSIFSTNTLSKLSFDYNSLSNPFYGNTKQIQYFDSALNDSDLETITSWTSFTDLANGQTYSIK